MWRRTCCLGVVCFLFAFQAVVISFAQEAGVWNVGLKAFQAGDSAPKAIEQIWEQLPPPQNLNLVAQIVGSLYADDYWDATHMNQTKLSGDLTSVIGVNPADANRAARYAFSRWSGLLVRANLSDQGVIPRSGALTASPAIVMVAAPLTSSQLISQWNRSIWSPKFGQKSYVYGRAESINLGVDINGPVLRCYYVGAGFNPPPHVWNPLLTANGDKTAALTNASGRTVIRPHRTMRQRRRPVHLQRAGIGAYQPDRRRQHRVLQERSSECRFKLELCDVDHQ